MNARKRPAPEFTADEVRDVSEAVYRDRLGDDLDDFLQQHGAAKLRAHAAAYDTLTRCYLRATRPRPKRGIFDD